MKKNNIIWILIFFSSSLYSQSDCCGDAYRRLKIRLDVIEGEDTCSVVAASLQSDLASTRATQPESNTLPVRPTPRDLQTRKTNVPNSIAAINQGDAAPSLYPFALGGGSVGGTGSEAGTNALTTLSLNPAIFFADMDDPSESAKWGRLMDMSVILPLNEIQSGTADKLSYFGVRARVNTTGAIKGSTLEKKVLDRYREVLKNISIEKDIIETLLRNAPDCKKCTEQLGKFSKGLVAASSIKAACGNEFISEGDVIYDAFDEALEDILEEADKKYFGLDLRGDFGDPTLGAVDSARGTSLYAGVGWGKSFKGDQDASKNFRLSLGVRYKDLETVDANAFDLDGAAGFDITWPYQFQQIKLGVGIEFRTNFEKNIEEMTEMDLTEAFETDYLYFRTSLNIPITPSNSFSFQYGTAIAGEKTTVLSLNFNWKLLLEDD